MAYYRCTGTPGGSLKLRTAQGEIASFETNLAEPYQSVKCNINPIQNGTPWIDSNVVNKEPYIKRAVAGTATRIGNHLYDKLVGGTVAFNQMCKLIDYSGTGVTITTDNTGLITIDGTATGTVYSWINNFDTFSVLNHVYFVSVSNAIEDILIYNDNAGVKLAYPDRQIIGKATDSKRFYLRIQSGAVLDNATLRINIIDLTAMFGSTIADYIYSLEQATAGAGVAWFKALFPNDYYAYNAGELMSVKATAHVMKNASNTVIGNYALDSNLVLNGLFKLDANNKLYADGDTYESSGAVGRRFASVDLGSLGWSYNSQYAFFYRSLTGAADVANDIICADYVVFNTWSELVADTTKNGMYKSNDANRSIYIRNTAYTDATAFKNAMSGHYLIYKVETPTTEQASPFTNPQVCDENGTEEYTDNRAVAIPVGHETYQANICPISGYTEANITANGDVITISFGQTVYGGVLDVTRGKLHVTWGRSDMGDLSYTKYDVSEGTLFRAGIDEAYLPANSLNIKSSIYLTTTSNNRVNYTISVGSEGRIDFINNDYSDKDVFKSAMAGIYVYYELATPFDIDLTPQQIEALLGVNNVWHDGNGNTEVKYLNLE